MHLHRGDTIDEGLTTQPSEFAQRLDKIAGLLEDLRRSMENARTPVVRQYNLKKVSELADGDCFRHPGGEEIYIKTNGVGGTNPFKWEPGIRRTMPRTGAVYSYKSDKYVVPVDAHIVHRGDLRWW